MFQDAYEKLDLPEIAAILEDVNPALENVSFDPVETDVSAVSVPFYPGWRFLEIASSNPASNMRCYVLHKAGEAVPLDFTNGPLYALNKKVPVHLDEDTVSLYVRFFFTYVRGRHGRFLICENVDDIRWKDEPPPAARLAVGKILKPVTVKSVSPGGAFRLVAYMIFKDSLFRSDVNVTKEGFVSLENEELLVEDIPVLDDVLGA